MRINEQLKALDEEIEELNAYTSAARMEKLAKLGAYLLPPSLVFGFFGVNTLAWDSYIGDISGWIVTLGVVISGAASVYRTKWLLGRSPRSKRSSNKYKEQA
jgi:Mg2+ and Co2+ transporter CorA